MKVVAIHIAPGARLPMRAVGDVHADALTSGTIRAGDPVDAAGP
ncbi:MAG: hypothetical protein ACKOQ4_13815 [Mycobacterium sp.]